MLIASLTPGTEVVLIDLEGKESIDIVWIVDGFSALTANGQILSCECQVCDIELTGRHFDRYPITQDARFAYKEMAELRGDIESAEESGLLDREWEDHTISEDPNIAAFKGHEWDNFDSEPE